MTAPASGVRANPASDTPTSGPATVVLSRAVTPGHEQAFEAVLHQLASEAGGFPGHQGLTVMRPRPGEQATYSVVAHFATGLDMDRWLSSDVRATLVAEADMHSAGMLHARYLSGLEGWLVPPGSPMVLPTARWKIVVLSMAGIVPLLEADSYLLAPHLGSVPVWARPLIAAAGLIPLMQYAVMPILTRVTRGFLYPVEPLPAAKGSP